MNKKKIQGQKKKYKRWKKIGMKEGKKKIKWKRKNVKIRYIWQRSWGIIYPLSKPHVR